MVVPLPCFVSEMDLCGKALLKHGNKVVLELEVPNAEDDQQRQQPQQPEQILRKIADGSLVVNPSKSNMTSRRVEIQV